MIVATDKTDQLPAKVEKRLRLRAFHFFYNKIYFDELDMTVRFAKALVASTKPIRNEKALRQWCESHGKELPL